MTQKTTPGFVSPPDTTKPKAPGKKRAIGFLQPEEPIALVRGFASVPDPQDIPSAHDMKRIQNKSFYKHKLEAGVLKLVVGVELFVLAATGLGVREAFVKTDIEGLSKEEITEARAVTARQSMEEITGIKKLGEATGVAAGLTSELLENGASIFEKNAGQARENILKRRHIEKLEK